MSENTASATDRELVRRIGRSAGRKAGYKQLVRELGLGGGRERRLLVEQLTKLVARGELVRAGDDLWSLPPSPEELASSRAARSAAVVEPPRCGRERLQSGRLDLHRDGFGFVRMDATGKQAGTSGEDIFIPPNEINGAMQGDLVLVDEMPPARDGRRSGRIARVLTRRNPTVVGIFHYGRSERLRERGDRGTLLHGNYVTPLDERVASLIAIPDGAEVVAVAADTPNRTLSAEARRRIIAEPLDDDEPQTNGTKRSRREPPRPLEGLAVDVEITDFPGPGRPARGRLIEVLGPPDAFGVDVEIVIRKHHIPHTFPASVLTEAAEQAQVSAATLTLDELAAREDFRGLGIVTIDGETAKDFDDAVLVRALPNGHTELQVHIADVSWYVAPESALDTEARVRGNSVYFPDRAIPMLPHALSSGMCSLLPNEDRLVMSCIMEIDAEGEIAGYRVAEGIIRSVRRCTYTSVQQCLNASPSSKQVTEPAAEDSVSAEDLAERERVGLEQPELLLAFDDMLALALRLNAKRVRRGSIDFDLPEPIVQFDPDGNMKAIVKSERGWAHRLIEEFMLSANECVARWLENCGIPSIYRIHEMPDPKRIVDFEETAAGFGQTLGIGSLPVRMLTMKADRRDIQRNAARRRDTRSNSRNQAPKHELPAKIPVTPQMYQKLVRRIQGTPEERILAYLMLRSLKQARYAEKNEGHFALASPSYTHFTSPIRRYPDLIVHRLLRAMLARGANPVGGAIRSTDEQPWQTELDRSKGKGAGPKAQGPAEPAASGPWALSHEPLSSAELTDIAAECSQTERRAADAERELIEGKKIKFMESHVGEDFHATVLSVTKYGFFVELDDLFIEGLVPLTSLVGDFYEFRDTDRSICGSRTGHCFKLGQRVEVILDRIDRQQRRLQFALLPGTEPTGDAGLLRAPSLRKRKITKEEPRPAKTSKRSGKSKTRQRNKKTKGKH